MNHTVIGVDIVNREFQLHCVDIESGEMVSVQLRREEFLENLANRATSLIGVMARGRMHWTRELEMLGHQVMLLPVRMFEPSLCGNKSEQQVLHALHRMRTQLVGFRTARARLAGYRGVMPKGRAAIPPDIRSTLKLLIKRMPAVLIDTLCEQYSLPESAR